MKYKDYSLIIMAIIVCTNAQLLYCLLENNLTLSILKLTEDIDEKKIKYSFNLMMEQTQICVSHDNTVLITSSYDTSIIS